MADHDDPRRTALVSLDSMALADQQDSDPDPPAFRTELMFSALACTGAAACVWVFSWVASAPVALQATIPVVGAAVWGQLAVLAQGKRAARISTSLQEKAALNAAKRHEEIVGMSRKKLAAEFSSTTELLIRAVGSVDYYLSEPGNWLEEVNDAFERARVHSVALMRIALELDDAEKIEKSKELWWVYYVGWAEHRTSPGWARAVQNKAYLLFPELSRDWEPRRTRASQYLEDYLATVDEQGELDNTGDTGDKPSP